MNETPPAVLSRHPHGSAPRADVRHRYAMRAAKAGLLNARPPRSWSTGTARPGRSHTSLDRLHIGPRPTVAPRRHRRTDPAAVRSPRERDWLRAAPTDATEWRREPLYQAAAQALAIAWPRSAAPAVKVYTCPEDVHLSVWIVSVPTMGIRRQIRAGALAGDDRELQARLVQTLNELQAVNERCRGLLIDGNLPGLVRMGGKVSDLGTLLMMIAARNDGADDDVDQAELFDVRQRAAGEHLG